MDYESSNTSPQRMFYRRDQKTSLLRAHALSLAECEKLMTEGFDPETVTEDELFRRATDSYEYDALERPTSVVSKFADVNISTYCRESE